MIIPETRKVARLEQWEPGIVVLVGWEVVRPCGCHALEGLRMDKPGPRDLVGEPVVSFNACQEPGHKAKLIEVSDHFLADAPTSELTMHAALMEYMSYPEVEA